MRACQICSEGMHPLPHPPNPVFQLHPDASVLICGQAPGNLVNQTGRPFTDPSGDRLRKWMGIGPEIFYDETRVAILPMGFCFPGYTANGSDKPPRKECAAEWREQALTILPNIRVSLLIGAYAQKWHLRKHYAGSVTQTVENWRQFAPDSFVLPHPSWRNNAWLNRHPWFEDDLLPELKNAVHSAL